MRKSAFLLALLAGAAPLAAAHAQSAASPFTSAQRFDEMRRVTGTISPDPDGSGSLPFRATRNTYDAAGRLTKVERGSLSSWQSDSVAPLDWGSAFSALEVTETAYDAMGRKTKETLSDGTTPHALTQYSYDGDGRLECTARRMNQAIFPTITTHACTLGTEGSFGPDRITKSLYDAAGQQVQLRRAVGTSIEAAEATYSYTDNGKRKFVIDGNGNKAELRYDGHDRQSRWVFPSATLPSAFNDASPSSALSSAGALNESDYEEYGYDANANRTSLRKRDGQTIAFSYDVLNRMSAKDIAGGTSADVAYSYDLQGLQLGATFSASSQGVTNAYDKAGRLTSSASNVGGTSRTLSHLYDAGGNRTRITHPDGNYFTYAYDGLDRATAILENGTTGLVAIAYDQLGRRATLSRTGGASTSYTYDGASRLASLAHDLAGSGEDVTATFGYSPASQVATRTLSNDLYAFTALANANVGYTKNGLNQYTAVGGTAHTYDGRGNLTSDGATTFAYDVENRLLTATGAKNATLTYDPLGRLDSLASGGATTRFLHDGDAMTLEYNGAGTLLRRYVHGPGTDEPLIHYEGSGLTDRRHLHADHQGSVIAQSEAAGSSIATNRYDEYGVPASTNAGRFQYTGQIWLGELGLYHYKARVYDPREGRFLQTDPVGYEDQINLYGYVANDPVNKTDPTGKQTAEYQLEAELKTLRDAGMPEDQVQQRMRDGALLQAGTLLGEGAAYLAVRALTWGARAIGIGRAAAPVLSPATRTAMAGGAHAGHFRSLMSSTIEGVQRSLNKNAATIAEHRVKIANPGRFMERGNPSNPSDVRNAVSAWQRTINRAEKQAEIARDVLRRKLDE